MLFYYNNSRSQPDLLLPVATGWMRQVDEDRQNVDNRKDKVAIH